MSKLNKLMTKLPNMIKDAVEMSIFKIIALIHKDKNKFKDAWLICERGTEAKDNGYKFFEYIRTNHPEINAYYIIDKQYTNDYNKVAKLGNIIQFKSFEHKLAFTIAPKLISTHMGFVEAWNYRLYKLLFGKFSNKKYVFLQHGVICNDVSDVASKRKTNFDLFITSANPEYKFILDKFGYSNKEVVCTGLARFDSLHDFKSKNQILLMPTWRSNITQSSDNSSDELFLNSNYYKTYQSLINNTKLIDLLEQSNYELVFYPHYEIQKYLNKFTSSSDRVIISSKDNNDVQELLKDSKLLITDYSSVFLDFVYMEKPVIYYQFDKNDFFNNHYKKGYFDYENDGFGAVVESEDLVIDEIEKLFKSNFEMHDQYLLRLNNFFKIKDNNNCERILNEISKI